MLSSIFSLDDDEDEEAALSEMLQQFKGQMKADKARQLRREMLGMSDEEREEEREMEAEEEANTEDGVDLGTRASWGTQKSRYYVGGREKDYEPGERCVQVRLTVCLDFLQALSSFETASLLQRNFRLPFGKRRNLTPCALKKV